MGIIEKILSEIQQLREDFAKVYDHSVVSESKKTDSKPTPIVAGGGFVEDDGKEITANPESEFDKNGDKWDERIHASTKTKTVKDIWTKRRGVNDIDYQRILKENREANQASNDTDSVPEIPETPAVPEVNKQPPETPSIPEITAPETPEVPKEKAEAIQLVNELYQNYEVDYNTILSEIQPGITSFDEVAMDNMSEVKLKLKAWCDWLNLCSTEESKINEIGGDPGKDGVKQICGFHQAVNIATVPLAKMNVLYESLKDYRGKWEASRG